MIEFSKQIAEKWALPKALTDLLCSSYERGDTPYYLSEYNPPIAVEISISIIWEIFDYLKSMEEVAAKRKRVLNAYKKTEKLTGALEKRVNHIVNTFELDDLLIPLRPNPRSKGQLASKKGIDSLVDLLISQKRGK